ncbi:MAG: histidinol dehydrogenase, partial [Thermodesulfovibrionales bacterium]
MKIIKTKKQIDSFLKVLKNRASGIDESIVNDTKTILSDVRKKGDKAVLRYTKRFDGISGTSLKLSKNDINRSAKKAVAMAIEA